MVPDRDAKSVSVEDTYEVDLMERDQVLFELDRLAARCVRRLKAAGRSGRTVVIKVRRFDFSTLTRSETLPGPTDDARVIAGTARRLAEQVSLAGGIRLLGVGVSQLAEYTQEDLFAQAAAELAEQEGRATTSRTSPTPRPRRRPRPGSRSASRSGCRGRTWCTRSTGAAGCRAAGWAG